MIDLRDSPERWRYTCPNGHRIQPANVSKNTVYCYYCDDAHTAITDARNDQRLTVADHTFQLW